jgi:hypothetical protein
MAEDKKYLLLEISLDCFIFSDDFAKIKFGISNRWFK